MAAVTSNGSTATNVSVGKPAVGGAAYRAPSGTTLPTDATTGLDVAYVGLGYISQDGLTNSNTPESDEIRAWGGDVVLTYQSAKPDTFTFTLIEALNVDVLEAVYGSDNVTINTENNLLTITANSTEPEEAVWVFDMLLRGGMRKRIVVPCGTVSEIGDIVYADEEAIGYELTISATPDSSGNTHYEYIQSGS